MRCARTVARSRPRCSSTRSAGGACWARPEATRCSRPRRCARGGHCLPTAAEGIRTALYFGLACGRELRAVVEGRRTREEALARYAAFSAAHARPFALLKRAQDLVGHVVPRERVLHATVAALS